MSMTFILLIAAGVFLLLLVGVAIIVVVVKRSKSGNAASASGPSPAGQFPQPSQPPTSFGAPDASAPASWPPPQPQQAPPTPSWDAPVGSPPPPQQAEAPSWPSSEPPPSAPPPSFGTGAAPDPYVTTPSVDPAEPLPNPELFMTTPSVPRQTSNFQSGEAQLRADDGSLIGLNRNLMRVGRHPECDIVIPTPGTSRQHAEFEFRDGAWVVTDLNSGNGTWVNNVRVRSQQLSPGDVVRIDQTRFTFEVGAS